jgi:hypothetical protein
MLTWLIQRRIRTFERSFNYDMSYARRILAARRRAFLLLGRLRALARYYEGVPPSTWPLAVRLLVITSSMAENFETNAR